MTDLYRLARHLDETFTDIRRDINATIRQLDEWTGEFPASTSGAPPAEATGTSFDIDDDPVKLTKVEADADRPDRARLAMVRTFELVDLLVIDATLLGNSLGGDVLPAPVERMSARLAFIQWQMNKVRAGRLHKKQTGRLEHAAGLGNELWSICTTYRPAPELTLRIDICHAHERAGGDSSIDARYRRQHLCRWCGEFRALYGINPPPKAVKMHDKGQKVTPAVLRQFGVRLQGA